MNIHDIFDHASRIMTVLSFATFLGILAWTYGLCRERDFAASAVLPFADNAADDAADDAVNGELEEDYV